MLIYNVVGGSSSTYSSYEHKSDDNQYHTKNRTTSKAQITKQKETKQKVKIRSG
jgi:hypothetical protein